MAELRRQVGFVPALVKVGARSLLWPEGFWALVVGGAGGVVLTRCSTLKVRLDVAADGLVVLAPLLGVVLAALTLVIVISSDEYTRFLGKASEGILGFYRPFIIAIGLEIWTILTIIGYRAVAQELPSIWERLVFCAMCILIVFTLLDILAIARNVLMHALTRSKLNIRT